MSCPPPSVITPDSAANRLKVPFGRLGMRIVAPGDALAIGLACGCVCPGCASRLVLKQGTRRRHFAHHNATGTEGCVESAIHAAAKQVLIDHAGLVVPEVAFEISAATLGGVLLRDEEVVSAQRRIRFDHTVAEVAIGDVRPDVVGFRGERRLLVEMYFRHRVDPEKRDKLKRLGLPALEIDLSDLDQLDDFDALKERVIDSVSHKEWLVYPRLDEHLAHLKDKLQERVDVANRTYWDELGRRRQERDRLAQLERTRQLASVEVDAAFARWPPDEQAAWIREQLGLPGALPAFLCRPLVPDAVLKAPAFLFNASIFERFIHRSKEGTRLTAAAVYPCLRRRFDLLPHDRRNHLLAINLYLEYLSRAGFLHRSPKDELTGPYFVRHSAVTMPSWTPPETRHDGAAPLTAGARGTGALREWSPSWPRWRAVMSDAEDLLADSPHRDRLIEGLQGLAGLTPPATPHHWAEPLVEHGVPLEDCLNLLASLGLIRDRASKL